MYQIEIDELNVIETYLPKQLDRADVIAKVKELIAAGGAISVKDAGKIIGMANKELAGKADGKTIAEVVKELLA